MYCINCGKNIEKDSKFCHGCGNEIKINAVKMIDKNKNRKKHSKKVLLCALSLLALSLLGGIIIAKLNKQEHIQVTPENMNKSNSIQKELLRQKNWLLDLVKSDETADVYINKEPVSFSMEEVSEFYEYGYVDGNDFFENSNRILSAAILEYQDQSPIMLYMMLRSGILEDVPHLGITLNSMTTKDPAYIEERAFIETNLRGEGNTSIFAIQEKDSTYLFCIQSLQNGLFDVNRSFQVDVYEVSHEGMEMVESIRGTEFELIDCMNEKIILSAHSYGDESFYYNAGNTMLERLEQYHQFDDWFLEEYIRRFSDTYTIEEGNETFAYPIATKDGAAIDILRIEQLQDRNRRQIIQYHDYTGIEELF